MYRYATGWLGWSHTEAMSAPLPCIQVALDGKVDFLKKTTPGAADPPERSKEDVQADVKRMLRAARPKG